MSKDPCLFSVNLTENALAEGHFLKFLGSLLERAGLPRGVLAVELQASVLAATRHVPPVLLRRWRPRARRSRSPA